MNRGPSGFGGPPFRGPSPGSFRGGRYYGGKRGGNGCGCGCFTLLAVIIIIGLLIAIFVLFSTDNAITKSTVNREPLPKNSVVETGYYTDELAWIQNPTKLTSGMKNFYKKTGVQPYLYITDTINDSHFPSDREAEAFANAVYSDLFADEAHFLLIFFEYNDNYRTWYLVGKQAKSVMDSEACDILLDYVDRYYYDNSLTDEEFFSLVFDKAGERIMKITRSPWIPALTTFIFLIIVVIAYAWWRKAKQQKKLEAEQTEAILKTPLETFGDSNLNDLENKYKGPE